MSAESLNVARANHVAMMSPGPAFVATSTQHCAKIRDSAMLTRPHVEDPCRASMVPGSSRVGLRGPRGSRLGRRLLCRGFQGPARAEPAAMSLRAEWVSVGSNRHNSGVNRAGSAWRPACGQGQASTPSPDRKRCGGLAGRHGPRQRRVSVRRRGKVLRGARRSAQFLGERQRGLIVRTIACRFWRSATAGGQESEANARQSQQGRPTILETGTVFMFSGWLAVGVRWADFTCLTR